MNGISVSSEESNVTLNSSAQPPANMNELLEKIYTTGKVEDKDGNAVNCFPTSVSFESGRLLHDLIQARGFKKTIEIGMAYGLSTLFICQALKDNGSGVHTSIDPDQDTSWQSIGLLNIKRAGLDEVLRFFKAPSYAVLPRLLSEGERFDFAFIDGMHLFDYALVDFFYIDRMLQAGGCVAFDDVWMPSIRKAISFVLRNRSYERVKAESGERFSAWKHVPSTARRFVRNPFEMDLKVKLISGNICVLKKLADDSRQWNHHRSF